MNDPVSAARDIVAAKSGKARHICPPPRPWWMPAWAAKCTCPIFRKKMAVFVGSCEWAGENFAHILIPVAEARIAAVCCRRHGSAR